MAKLTQQISTGKTEIGKSPRGNRYWESDTEKSLPAKLTQVNGHRETDTGKT